MFGIPPQHFSRYYEILTVLIRNGLGFMLFSGRAMPQQGGNLALVGVQLRNACSELGPAFIKVGQLASTRSDIVPQPIVRELAKLQDRVPPLSFEVARRVVEGALQARLEAVYQEFNPYPLAAASIGQVHYAVLRSGEKVAVKVQRPYLRETVKTDLEIFQFIVGQIERRTEWARKYPLRMMLEEFSEMIKGELDFLKEGQNAEKLAQASRNNPDIIIPKIYWEFSHASVLTMEYIEGIPLHQIIASGQAAHNTRLIAQRLSKAVLQQILTEGCFHADPHPGNVLILAADKVALIDFGITGHLSDAMRSQILSLVSGLLRGNDDLILKTLAQMGIVPETVDRVCFQRDISGLRDKHLNLSQKKFAMGEAIQDFFDVIFRHGIHIPSEFILVGKSLLTLEGTLNDLDPTLSLVEQAKPFSRRFFWDKLKIGTMWKRFWGIRETDTSR